MIKNIVSGAVAVVAGLYAAGGDLGHILDPSIVPGWWPWASPMSFFAMGAAFLLVGYGAHRATRSTDSGRGETMTSLASLVAALGLFALLWVLYRAGTATGDLTTFVGLTILVYASLHVIWTYFQYRSSSRSGRVAIRRTQGSISRDVRDTASLVFGVVLLSISIISGLWLGVAQALPAVGDALLPLTSELAYLGTVITGYLTISGEWSLSALQWAGLALLIGGIAIMIGR